MMETFCDRCRKPYLIQARKDKCPWCEEEDRIVGLVAFIVGMLVAVIIGCVWWMQ